jgi:hypothetical protein
VIGYLTAADSHFLGTRVEDRADGVAVFLMYGTASVAQTRTVHGDYLFTNVAPGGYTTRAVAPGDLTYESRPLVINGVSVYSRDTLRLKSRGDLYPSPNPVVSDTWISYVLAESSDVELNMCDAEGRVVKQLRRGFKYPPGFYEARWDGRSSDGTQAPIGLYWAVFASGSDLRTQAIFRDSLPPATPVMARASAR